jgi:hypothetical protein
MNCTSALRHGGRPRRDVAALEDTAVPLHAPRPDIDLEVTRANRDRLPRDLPALLADGGTAAR